MKNQMKVRPFLFSTVFLLFMQTALCRGVAYRPINGIAPWFSEILFWGSTLLALCAGVLFTVEKHRTFLNMLLIGSFPGAAWTAAAYAGTLPGRVFIPLLAAFVLGIGCFLIVFLRPVPHKLMRDLNGLLKHRAAYGGRMLASVMALALIFGVMYPMLVCEAFGIPMTPAGTEKLSSVNAENAEDWTVENRTDELSVLFSPDFAETFSAKEKLFYVRVLANIETNRLDLVKGVNISGTDVKESSIGYYRSVGRLVAIDMEYLEDATGEQICEVIFHECRHAYQHQLVDMYDKFHKTVMIPFSEKAECYKYEFAHYIQPEDDFTGYWNQKCEADARAYAYEETAWIVTAFKGAVSA